MVEKRMYQLTLDEGEAILLSAIVTSMGCPNEVGVLVAIIEHQDKIGGLLDKTVMLIQSVVGDGSPVPR